MKKIMLLSILLFTLSQFGMPCMANEVVWSNLLRYKLCYSCMDYEWHYHKYSYSSTDLYVPPDNKEIDGKIADDRRCKTHQSGERILIWWESLGETNQVAHSWQVTLEIASSVLGLSAGVTHQNDWSWACNKTTGQGQQQAVSFVTPYGEYGEHDIEWMCEGIEHEGLWTLEVFHGAGKTDKCWSCSEIINYNATSKRKERSPIATAGDWNCVSTSCDDGCGWQDQKCDGCRSCGNLQCDHYEE